MSLSFGVPKPDCSISDKGIVKSFYSFQGMDNDSVVEQIVRSLSFEVEAIPQDNVIHLTTTTKSAPLNVKIRVRKKEEAGFKHGVLSLPKPDRPNSAPVHHQQRVRLASSDQTIMSFNVVMEADFQKPVKKPRRNILGIFKPCEYYLFYLIAFKNNQVLNSNL